MTTLPRAALAVVLALAVGSCLPAADRRIEVVNLNLLHGFDCDPPSPAQGDQCRLGERVDLLFDHVVDAGCPDLVTLQEVIDAPFVLRGGGQAVGPLDSSLALITAGLDGAEARCGFRYELVFAPIPIGLIQVTDEELILSRYPVLDSETRLLHSALFVPGGFPQLFARHALYVRVDHPTGPVDVFTTHLASGSDFATNACDSFADLGSGVTARVACPAECDPAGSVRECQARQLVLFAEERHDVAHPAFVTGDLNAEPDSPELAELLGAGWIDSHTEVAAQACGTEGIGCTSGRSETGGDLEDPVLNVDRRIDYVLVLPPGEGAACAGELVPEGTGLFAHEPNPFAPACGPAPLPVCWTSDHSGNRAELSCDRLPRPSDAAP